MTRRTFLGSAVLSASGLVPANEQTVAPAPTAGTKTGALGKIVGTLPPGRYDAHIHIYKSGIGTPRPEEFRDETLKQGVTGGCVFSASPNPQPLIGTPLFTDPEKAMDNCIGWCSASPTLYPFYWIDPGAPNALELVDMAVAKGFYGFKVIRNNGMPCDERTLPVYARMAEANKPVTFHSGILFDGMPSSQYFRPANFEPLLNVPGLRFALAHVSWPWHEECIAVFGKMRDAGIRHRVGKMPTMFLDTTIGSPRIYRKDVFDALYSVYNTTDRVLFGTDHFVAHYDPEGRTPETMAFDDKLLTDLGKDAKTVDSYYRAALEKFLFGF